MSIELLKVVKGGPIDQYRNVFLNLALPLMVLSEPAAAERTEIRQGLSYTLWDKWEVRGHANYSLREFLKHFVVRYHSVCGCLMANSSCCLITIQAIINYAPVNEVMLYLFEQFGCIFV